MQLERRFATSARRASSTGDGLPSHLV